MPMEVRPSGRSIAVRLEQFWNALPPIVVTESASWTWVRLSSPLKALSPMAVTPSSTMTAAISRFQSYQGCLIVVISHMGPVPLMRSTLSSSAQNTLSPH